MAKNVRIIHCTPEEVFDVLRDGWLYPTWVVGASRMRGEDPGWPAVGTKLHHSFGVWPLVINDTTSVLEYDEPRRMVIQARGWPVGGGPRRGRGRTAPPRLPCHPAGEPREGPGDARSRLPRTARHLVPQP
ncbi:SRPBCC family protein [Curtobacterium sp. MCPF17_052]|uniref:SRPBCC family protein n=1 Tax=Curtobacterium sp. MCPF17_052 TaxID=2175655 RepID=UPI0034639874